MFLCKSLCWLCEEWDMKHYQYSCMLLEKWRNKMLFSVLPNVNVTLEESAPPQPRTSPLVPGWYISSSQTGEFRTDRVSHINRRVIRQHRCGSDGRGQPCVTAALHARAHTQTRGRGLVGVRGRGCCCYDAMATAPWEASLELNEFPPQLE